MSEQLDWLLNRKSLGVKLGLDRLRLLLDKLGNPQNELKIIHLAGTNGKGSTANFITNGLIEAGFKTGLFSSPSLEGYTGQIKINNQAISKADLNRIISQIKPTVLELDKNSHTNGLTEFEILTAIMWVYFAQNKVDYAVVEAGMGGLEDSTNICQPLISCITSISYDHIGILGSDLKQIAHHKAGIIKHKTPVITTQLDSISYQVVSDKAKEESAPLIIAKPYNYPVKMAGAHQVNNANLAVEVLKMLEIGDLAIKNSLLKTQIPARLEYLSNSPALLVDGAHNPAGSQALVDYLNTTNYKEINILFAALKTKDIKKMLEILSTVENLNQITITNFDHERSTSQEDNQKIAEYFSFNFQADWQKAFDQLLNKQTDDQLVLVTGSLYFLTQVRDYYFSSYQKAAVGE